MGAGHLQVLPGDQVALVQDDDEPVVAVGHGSLLYLQAPKTPGIQHLGNMSTVLKCTNYVM